MVILFFPTVYTQTKWWVNTVHHLCSSLMHVQIVFQKIWSGSDETASMLSHSVIVTVQFPRTDSFTHSTFEVGEALRNLCYSNYLTSKSCLQHFESLCSIFLQFKSYSSVLCRHAAVPSRPFLGVAKSQIEQRTCTSSSLSNQTCYSLISSVKWVIRLCCMYIHW